MGLFERQSELSCKEEPEAFGKTIKNCLAEPHKPQVSKTKHRLAEQNRNKYDILI